MDDETKARLDKMEAALAKAGTLHEAIADALGLTSARCRTCGDVTKIENVAACLRSGWPTCCGRTMVVG